MVVLFLVFKETSILFFIVDIPIYILTNCIRGFPFLHIPSSTYIYRLFVDGHYDLCEVDLVVVLICISLIITSAVYGVTK